MAAIADIEYFEDPKLIFQTAGRCFRELTTCKSLASACFTVSTQPICSFICIPLAENPPLFAACLGACLSGANEDGTFDGTPKLVNGTVVFEK